MSDQKPYKDKTIIKHEILQLAARGYKIHGIRIWLRKKYGKHVPKISSIEKFVTSPTNLPIIKSLREDYLGDIDSINLALAGPRLRKLSEDYEKLKKLAEMDLPVADLLKVMDKSHKVLGQIQGEIKQIESSGQEYAGDRSVSSRGRKGQEESKTSNAEKALDKGHISERQIDRLFNFETETSRLN